MVEPATRAVLAALAAGGVEARFVGGSVRDALRSGRPDRPTSTSPPRRRPSGSSSCLEKTRHQGRTDRSRPRHGDRSRAAAAFRDHDVAARCRDLRSARPRRLRRRLGRGCGAPRLHDQRDLSRPGRDHPRSGRRPADLRGPPGALCRRSARPGSPRMCCGCCAITASRRVSEPATGDPAARAACRAAATSVADPLGRARRAGADQAAARDPGPDRRYCR